MKHLSIQFKVTILLLLSLGLTVLLSTVVSVVLSKQEAHERLVDLRETLSQEKIVALSEKVEIAKKIIQVHYASAQKEIQEGKEKQSVTQAHQTKAKEAIKALRFGNDGYFWINDFTPTMVMHSTNPSLDGKALGQIKDPNGKFLFNEFVFFLFFLS